MFSICYSQSCKLAIADKYSVTIIQSMKVRKVSARGTTIRDSEVGEQNWTGDAYRAEQKKRLESIGRNITLHLGRGTKTTTLKDLPQPRPRPSTEGRTRVTNRGTGSRPSRNKGSTA